MVPILRIEFSPIISGVLSCLYFQHYLGILTHCTYSTSGESFLVSHFLTVLELSLDELAVQKSKNISHLSEPATVTPSDKLQILSVHLYFI